MIRRLKEIVKKWKNVNYYKGVSGLSLNGEIQSILKAESGGPSSVCLFFDFSRCAISVILWRKKLFELAEIFVGG